MDILDGVEPKPVEVITRDEVLMRADQNREDRRDSVAPAQAFLTRHGCIVFDDQLTHVAKVTSHETAVGIICQLGAAASEEQMVVKVRRPHGIVGMQLAGRVQPVLPVRARRSEEHTSELQSQSNLVCRLLLEKKKK